MNDPERLGSKREANDYSPTSAYRYPKKPNDNDWVAVVKMLFWLTATIEHDNRITRVRPERVVVQSSDDLHNSHCRYYLLRASSYEPG